MQKKPLLVAMSFLPPAIQAAMRESGFSPVRIEESGALRLSISNEIPVEKKSSAVAALRRVLLDYGLDLSRTMGDVSSGSPRDESCLVVKRDAGGDMFPLFRMSGEPYPDMPSAPAECLATQVSERQRPVARAVSIDDVAG